MQAAKGVLDRATVVVLDEGAGDAAGREALGMVALKEEATAVRVHGGLD